jgi:hypothetical protein
MCASWLETTPAYFRLQRHDGRGPEALNGSRGALGAARPVALGGCPLAREVGGPSSVPDTAQQARLDDRLVHRDERGLVDAGGRNDPPIRWITVRPLPLCSADCNPRAHREQLQTSVFTERGINPDGGGAVKLQFARTRLEWFRRTAIARQPLKRRCATSTHQ